MDKTLGDSLERGTPVESEPSPEGPARGGGGGVLPPGDSSRAAPSSLHPPAARRGRMARRCRPRRDAEQEEEATTVVQPPAAASPHPPPAICMSRKRRRKASEVRAGRRGGGGEESRSAAANRHRFPNESRREPPLQPSSSSSCSSTSSSSSSSSLSSTSEDDRSLSFLTAEERAWLGAEAAAAAGVRESDADAAVHTAQVEGDELLARQLQEQYDRELHRRNLPLFGGGGGWFRQRHQPDLGREYMDDVFDLPGSDRPWLADVQWAAISSLMSGGDLVAAQRGRGGRRRGSRRVAAAAGGIEAAHHLVWPSHDYEALLAFEDRQGPAAAAAAKKRLSKREINALPPTKAYEVGAAGDGGNTRCQICFCDYVSGEELRALACTHDYHAKCIDRWLRVNATCPVCRCDMAERRPCRRRET